MHKTIGIVIHTLAFADKDTIAKIYTQKFGMVSFLIKGTKSAKAKIPASLLQPLSVLEISFNNFESKALQTITEATIHQHFEPLFANIYKSSIVYFMNEVLYKSIKEEESNEAIFTFTINKLKALSVQEELYFFASQFLVELSYYLGFYPSDNHSNSNLFFDMIEGVYTSSIPAHSCFLSTFESEIFANYTSGNYQINIGRTERNMMLLKIVQYYQLHISNFGNLKTLKVLAEVFD